MENISIAMATYNGEAYLREQLDSILNQTIPATEIVVCDDCSTDATWSILSEYAEKYTCFKVIRNEKNIGFLHNFEKAISFCLGDYIALSDQDDVWLPNHLQVLLEGLGNKILSVGDAELIDSNGTPLGYKLSYCENLDFIPEDDLQKAYAILYYRNPFQGASMLCRKELFRKAFPIPEGIEYHDSWLVLYACFYGGVQYIGRTVTLYRRHDSTVTGKKIRRTRFRALVSHLLFNRRSYRPIMVSAIKQKGCNLNKNQKGVLLEAERYYIRKKTLLGRIANLIFDLRYYKLIFGTTKYYL